MALRGERLAFIVRSNILGVKDVIGCSQFAKTTILYENLRFPDHLRPHTGLVRRGGVELSLIIYANTY